MNGVSGAYSAHCPWTHLLQTLIRRLRFDRGAAAGAAHLDFFGSNHHVDVTHLLVQVAQQLLKQAFFCDFFFFFPCQRVAALLIGADNRTISQ